MIAIPATITILAIFALIYAYKREAYWKQEAEDLKGVFSDEDYWACRKHCIWWNEKNKYFWFALQLSLIFLYWSGKQLGY